MALYPSEITLPSEATVPGGYPPLAAPGASTAPWGTVDGVLALLGVRLPSDVSVDVHLRRAHAVALTWLAKVYPLGVPPFAGIALEVVGDAEEALAAASVMSRLLVNVENADWTAVNAWREDAKAVLRSPVPGYDPSTSLDPDGAGPLKPVTPAPVAVSTRGPYVSSGLLRDARTGDLIEGLDADPWPY